MEPEKKKISLSDLQKEEITKICKRRSRFVWSDKALGHTFLLLERILNNEIKITDYLPGNIMTYHDYLYERDLLKFIT